MGRAKKHISKSKLIGLIKGRYTSIPIEHQQLVMARIKEAEQNPRTILDWDEVSRKLL